MIKKSELADAYTNEIARKVELYEEMIDGEIKNQYPQFGKTEIRSSSFEAANLPILCPNCSRYDSDIIGRLTKKYTEAGGWNFIYRADLLTENSIQITIYPV